MAKVDYGFVYELMRAYDGGNLLVNKRYFGGKVEDFLDIPNSVMQEVRFKGNIYRYQGVEINIPWYLKRKRAIEKYLRNVEEKTFQGKLLPVSDEEIEYFNTYWGFNFIGLVSECLPDNCAAWVKTDSEGYSEKTLFVSLEAGKPVNDAFEVLFKPLAYIGG